MYYYLLISGPTMQLNINAKHAILAMLPKLKTQCTIISTVFIKWMQKRTLLPMVNYQKQQDDINVEYVEVFLK